jgi:hypothetical protein
VRLGVSTNTERAARWLWSVWGEYQGHTGCYECGRSRYCHAQRPRGRWLCLECFDLSPEATVFVEHKA